MSQCLAYWGERLTSYSEFLQDHFSRSMSIMDGCYLSFSALPLLCTNSLLRVGGLILSLFVVFLVASWIHLLVLHPLSDIPGPRVCSVSRIPYWLASLQGRDVQWLYDLHTKYGPVVRFGPTDLSYATAEAWKDIHGHSKSKCENGKAPEFSVQPANGMSPLP